MTQAYRRYDWPSVKMVFVEGTVDDDGERTYPNLREVADLFDVPYVRVREHSAKEAWLDERAAFQANIERVRQERRAKSLAQDAIDMDKRALTMAKTAMQLVGARLAEIGQAVAAQQRAEAEQGADAARSRGALPLIDARELATLVSAGQDAYALGSKALGEVPTTRHEITGVGGSPVRTQTDVRGELRTDDPDRLAKFLVAAERSGLLSVASAVAVGGADPPALDAAAVELAAPDEPADP